LDLASPEVHHPVCTYTKVLQHQLPLLSDGPPMKRQNTYHHQTTSLYPDGWMTQRGGPDISQVSSSVVKKWFLPLVSSEVISVLVYAQKTTQKG